MHFVSMHFDIGRRLDPKPHLPALDAQNHDTDIGPDRDTFSAAPRQYKHVGLPWRMKQFTRLYRSRGGRT
jgi:hypothetical protein